jgi:hypothetical protein
MRHITEQWEVRPYLTPEREDDPMGVYCVEPVSSELTKRYSTAEHAQSFEAIHTENRAIAQLIAAAPELLQACIEARWCINHHGIVGDPASFMLDAAISKAEGKES